MRLASLVPTLVALATLAHAEVIHIINHLDSPVWYTQVTQSGRAPVQKLEPGDAHTIPQSDDYGVAIKITPDEKDIDIPDKGVLTLGYNKHPQGWIYYDIGAYLYYPWTGKRTKLGGPGGDNDWSDGQAHPQNTIAYNGKGDLWLDIGY